MAKLLKLRRGTTSQHSSFTGAEGEVTVDTDKETLVVHNGSTAGGFPVMSAAGGTFTGAVTFNAGVNYEGDLDLQDNDKLLIGTGDDLQIWHSGSDSHIKSTTGDLFIDSGNELLLRNTSTEKYIRCVNNGAVELFYNNILQTKTTSTGLSLGDNKRIDFGDDANIQIKHDGTYSRITNYTGTFLFDTVGEFQLRQTNTEKYIKAVANAQVELYYDNSKKLETQSLGVNITGNLDLEDDGKVRLGTASDLQIYHNGTNSFIQNENGHLYIHQNDATKDIYFLAKSFAFNNEANTENMITATTDGAVKLFYDGAQKIQTKSTGVYIQGSMGIELENSYFIYPNNSAILYIRSGSSSSNSIALQTNGTTRGWINCNSSNEVGFLDSDGAWAIQHIRDDATNFKINNVQKAQINGNGLNVSGLLSFNGGAGHYITMADGQKIGIGTSNDMNLRHESGHTYIENNTGSLYIRTKTSEDGIIIEPDAGVKQYYDSNRITYLSSVGIVMDANKDIRMTSGNWTGDCGTGTAKIQCHSNHLYLCAAGGKHIFRQSDGSEYVNIESGGIMPAANNSFNLGSSSYRWANLYVNDAHFSNEGSSNSVDGTWGDWTLQEGEDDIFMLNNRSGKKYKMSLTEVS